MKVTIGLFLCFLIFAGESMADSILIKKEQTESGMIISFSNTNVNMHKYPIEIMFRDKSPEEKLMDEIANVKRNKEAMQEDRTKRAIADLESEVKHRIDLEKRRLQDNLKECEQKNRLVVNIERCKAPIEEAIKRLDKDPEFYYYKRNLEGR